MKFESFKNLSLGKKIVIATVNCNSCTSFWNYFALRKNIFYTIHEFLTSVFFYVMKP